MKAAVCVVLVVMSTLSASALEDLVRADFGNCTPGQQPLAQVGQLSTGTAFTVVSSGGGFSNNCARIWAWETKRIEHVWQPSSRTAAGEFSIQWDMNIVTYPEADSPIFFGTSLLNPFGYSDSASSLYFSTNGLFWFGGHQISTPYQQNAVHRYRIDYDLSTGKEVFWMDGKRLADDIIDQRTQFSFLHAKLIIHSNYNSFVYLDNIHVTHAQPWVPSLWANFAGLPLGDLALGELPGYPAQDAVTNIQKNFFQWDNVSITNLIDGSGAGLHVQHRVPTTIVNKPIQVDFAPNSTNLSDGRYRLRYTFSREGAEGTTSVKLMAADNPIIETRLEGPWFGVTTNSSIVFSTSMLTTPQVEYEIEAIVDTLADTYCLWMNKSMAVSNWPTYSGGPPVGIQISTRTSATDAVYFDDIGLERRGREGVYLLRNAGNHRGIQKYGTASRQLEQYEQTATGTGTDIDYVDGDFGADGYIYALNSSVAPGIRVYDPYTLQQVAFFTNEYIRAYPRGIASYSDGRIAVHSSIDAAAGHDEVVIFSGMPDMEYVTTLVQTTGYNVSKMRLSHDEEVLIFKSNASGGWIQRHDARTGEYLGFLSSATNMGISQIDDLEVGPDNLLYVLNTSGTNISVLNHTTDTFVGTLPDMFGMRYPENLQFLPNGDLLVADVDNQTSRVVVIDRHTWEYAGDYELFGTNIIAGRRLLASPPLRITAVQPGDGADTISLTVDGDEGRYYSLMVSTNLASHVWTPDTSEYHTDTAWPVLVYTNDASSNADFLQVGESGL